MKKMIVMQIIEKNDIENRENSLTDPTETPVLNERYLSTPL